MVNNNDTFLYTGGARHRERSMERASRTFHGESTGWATTALKYAVGSSTRRQPTCRTCKLEIRHGFS
eukprot:11173180-Lingulodinium_polyedra.AAC.1